MGLKIIGAGFGRTGTTSLKAALERLGFGTCHHMVEVLKHPQQAPHWLAAARGEAVDWDSLFAGYQSSLDWPSCIFYRELMQLYPDAKVLLTVRDPERWYESVAQTIYPLTLNTPRWLPARGLKAVARVGSATAWDGTFHGRFLNRDYAIKIFNDHIEQVKRDVPPERLLVYSVKQGWEPLCEFLGVDTPAEPFPHLNDRQQMRTRIRVLKGIRWAARAGVVGAAALAWSRLRRS